MRIRKKRRAPEFRPVAIEPSGALMAVRFGPNENASPGEYEPGDFILTYSRGFSGWLIRVGQWLRYSSTSPRRPGSAPHHNCSRLRTNGLQLSPSSGPSATFSPQAGRRALAACSRREPLSPLAGRGWPKAR